MRRMDGFEAATILRSAAQLIRRAAQFGYEAFDVYNTPMHLEDLADVFEAEPQRIERKKESG